MTTVRFVTAEGETVETVVEPGARLLDVAQAKGMPLEGACEGAMACSTCHVIFSEADFARLPQASEEEEDMLDFAWGATRTSRLACQVHVDAAWDTLEVRIPAGSTNMQGR